MDIGDEDALALTLDMGRPPRRYVTTACDQCRESKIKCDATRPRCGHCSKKNKTCQYAEKNDKRKVSLRATVDLLSRRVNELSSVLLENGIPFPAMPDEELTMLNKVLETLELPVPPLSHGKMQSCSTLQASHQSPTELTADAREATTISAPDFGLNLSGPGETESLPEHQPFTDANLDDSFMLQGSSGASDAGSLEWAWFALETNMATTFAMNGGYLQPASEYIMRPDVSIDSGFPNPFEPASDSVDEDDDTDLVKQLSARFGSLHLSPDGQLRFWGANAHVHFLEEQTKAHMSTTKRSVLEEGHFLLEHASLNAPIDPGFVNHLLELYFTRHEPCMPLINRTNFESARIHFESGDESTGYCSAVLLNAMCATGALFEAKYHQTFVTFPKSLAAFFAERAKVVLEIELDSPCVATMQGLILLSNHEASVNHDARGWLYSGMAMRLAFDLGLHLDCTPYVRLGRISPLEAEARRTAYWGAYVVNHFYSFYTSRPFQVDVKEITVARPPRSSNVGGPPQLNSMPCNGSQTPSTGNVRGIAGELVYLCETVAQQAHMLYMYNATNTEELIAASQATTARLFAWKAELPQELCYSAQDARLSCPSDIVTLHMLYHYLQIMLHRPFTSRISQPIVPHGPGHKHARQVCIDSAVNIASLLQTCEVRNGFEPVNVHFVHVAFSAALILIFAMLSDERGEPSRGAGLTAKHLSACFRALDGLGHTIERAKNVQECLVAIQARWSQVKRKYESARRSGRLQSESKRRRLSGSRSFGSLQ